MVDVNRNEAPQPDSCDVRMVHPEKVEYARDHLLSPDDANSLAERFKLLSDPGRVRIIYALLEAGELCVCDLAATVEASESATSHQLRQLRLAGLVRARKEGRTVYYRLDDTHVRLLLDVAVEHYLHDHDRRR
jgi:DNA-binding transcriptional ArsR family regulator